MDDLVKLVRGIAEDISIIGLVFTVMAIFLIMSQCANTINIRDIENHLGEYIEIMNENRE